MPIQGLFPVLPLIRDEFGASYVTISLYVASLGVVRLILALPSGYWADRFDRKKVLILTGLLCVAGQLVMVLSTNMALLIFSRVLTGAASIMTTITLTVVLAQMSSATGKGVTLSMNNVVHQASGIVSSAAAGFLAAWGGWRLPFWVFAALVAISIIVILFLRLPGPNQSEPRARAKGSWRSGVLSAGRSFWFLFLLSAFVFFFRGGLRHTLIPLIGQDVLQISVERLGIYLSLLSAMAVCGISLGGWLSDRYGRKAVLGAGLILSTAAALAFLMSEYFNPFLPACFLIGAGAIINSMPNILASDLAPPSSLGRIIGANRFFGDTAYFAGPFIVGLLLDHFGFQAPLIVVAAFGIVTLAVVMIFVPARTGLEAVRAR